MMPDRRSAGLLLVACLAPFLALAQLEPFLLLEKAGTEKRIRYHAGDEIRFKMYGDDSIKMGVITGIGDSVFFLQQNAGVRYDEVEEVIIARRGNARGIGIQAFYAIPAILVFSAANNHFNTGRTPVIDDAAWTVSGAFALIGLASLTIGPDKQYKLKNRWRLIPVIH